jgi:O-antigen/teichoic acid export membrane protein
MVVGLWLTPFTLRFLDREEFAIFALAGDLLMWLSLFDLGIAAGLRMQAAQLSGRPDSERMNRLASTAFFAELVVVGAVILGGLGVAVAFPSFFRVRPGLESDATNVVFLMALGVAMHIGTQTFSALLVAHQQIHADNLIRVTLVLVRTGLIVVFLNWGWKLYAIAFATLAATVLTSLLALARAYRVVKGLRIRPSLASWTEFKATGTLGLWFTVGALAGILIEGMDRAVAGRLISLVSVTALSLTGRLYALAYTMIAQVTNTARPGLGQLFGAGDVDGVGRAYDRIFVLSTGLAIVAACSILAGNADFVRWWVGPSNYGGGWLDLALAINLVVNCWVLPNRATLSAALVVKPQSFCRVGEGALKLVVSVGLAYVLGLPGIVAGTAVACAATSLWYLPLLTARSLQRPLRSLWLDRVPRLVATGAVTACVGLAARAIDIGGMGLIDAGLRVVVTGAVGLGLLWFVGLGPGGRSAFLGLLPTKPKPVAP